MARKNADVQDGNGTVQEVIPIQTFTVSDERILKRTKERLCIVGCADSKNIVPWDAPDMEFWGVNNLYGVQLVGAHYDRWFEIHRIEIGADGKYRRRENLDFRGQPVDQYLMGLAKMDCPIIYMQKKWDIVPQSVEYPLEIITRVFGRYFTNTISYEIALGILMGFKEIHVYGVDMAVGTEYEHQRPSCEYFLGWATGMGIKVFIPDEADLLKNRFLYGFEEPRRTRFENNLAARVANIEKKKSIYLQQLNALDVNYRNQRDSLLAQIHQSVGAQEGINAMRKVWANLDDEIYPKSESV